MVEHPELVQLFGPELPPNALIPDVLLPVSAYFEIGVPLHAIGGREEKGEPTHCSGNTTPPEALTLGNPRIKNSSRKGTSLGERKITNMD